MHNTSLYKVEHFFFNFRRYTCDIFFINFYVTLKIEAIYYGQDYDFNSDNLNYSQETLSVILITFLIYSIIKIII